VPKKLAIRAAAGCIRGTASGLAGRLLASSGRFHADGHPHGDPLAKRGDTVSLPAWIVELLKREKVPYTCFSHVRAYTAQEAAAVSHIPQRCWAKVVVCIADDHPVEAVLPANYTVDLEQLRQLANAMALRLALEEEIAALHPECEVGAMPPFGAACGHQVFVDRTLVGEPEMVFNAGTHTHAICMHYGDFAELAKPTVGTFGRSPSRRHTASNARLGC
jgi:Ala-tRNA(Pro) deacylase